MPHGAAECATWRQPIVVVGALVAFSWASIIGCRGSAPSVRVAVPTTLRIGVSTGQMAAANPQNGVRQVAQNQSVEALVRIGDDGRPNPSLARSWNSASDGRSLKVRLQPRVTFHDGSPVTASTVAELLQRALPDFMGKAFEDIERISASRENDLDITLRRHSTFVLEALDIQLRSLGENPAGTGPFEPGGPASPTELQANEHFYLGRPIIDRIAVSTYPTVRAAWAEMLRDHLDMLYDVGTDALDSFERSNKISVFTYVRPYQYALVFNTNKDTLRSALIREALGQAIDRDAIVREGLNGHGVPSSGPIWPHHWAIESARDRRMFNPEAAAKTLGKEKLHFTCLVPADYERLALVVKRQLQAVGVTMDVQESKTDEIYGAMARRDFDAVLFDLVSGPSIFRLQRVWHSGEVTNPSGFLSAAVDAALDGIRRATSDNEYRSGVAALESAMQKDPPAIFLAWSERARAVSKRFVVPNAEPGRDILSTLRLWKPADDRQNVSRN